MNSAGLRIVVLVIVAAIVMGVRYAGRPGRPSSTGGVVRLDGGNPDLMRATQEARRRWPEFLEAFQNRKPDQHFTVKHGFKARGGGVEYLWIEIDSVQRTTVRGRLANQPVSNIGRKLGDVVTVDQSTIDDWAYNDGETIVGNFSEKVLEKIQERGR